MTQDARELNSEVPLRVLDLFSGMGGFSQAFRDRGHEVVRVELDERYEAEVHANVLDLEHHLEPLDAHWDIILASPPCEKHSIMAASHYWKVDDHGFLPTTTSAIHHTNLALHALYLIAALEPVAAILENPRGLMRKILPVKPHTTVTYCQYGDTRMKPTDLWLFGAARNFYFKPMCKNGAGCHEASPRGARTGTQTPMSYWERSLVPYGLSETICEQMEQHDAGTLVPGRLAV